MVFLAAQIETVLPQPWDRKSEGSGPGLSYQSSKAPQEGPCWKGTDQRSMGIFSR